MKTETVSKAKFLSPTVGAAMIPLETGVNILHKKSVKYISVRLPLI